MRAVLPADPERGHRPRLGDLAEPVRGADEVLVEVRATALNRADLLQLRGLYPPPAGESEIPGLECAGVVLESAVDEWRSGDRVMALLAGGGHAERVAVPVGQLMPIPEGMSFEEGAAIPEAALTAWTNLAGEARLEPGESVLITGATGGVGSFALQLAAELGATVIGAARDSEALRSAGVELAVTDDDSLPARVRELTDGAGVDVILDLSSGPLLAAHLEALADRGRLVLVGLMAGARAQLDLGAVLTRRLVIRGSVLRSRSRQEKASLVTAFHAFAADRLADGRLRPSIHATFPLERLPDAYATLERGSVAGKVVVFVDL